MYDAFAGPEIEYRREKLLDAAQRHSRRQSSRRRVRRLRIRRQTLRLA